MELNELAKKFSELRLEKDRLTQELKEINKALEATQHNLWEKMEDMDITNFKTPEGTFIQSHRIFASVKDEIPAFEFLKNTGNEGLIKQTVHTGSLSSAVKQLVEEGTLDIHEFENHGINAYVKETISLRRSS